MPAQSNRMSSIFLSTIFASLTLLIGFSPSAHAQFPPVPTGLSPYDGAQVAATTQVVLSWTAVPGASSYNVRANNWSNSVIRDPQNNCPNSPHYLCVNGVVATSIAMPVDPGSSYGFFLHACNAAGCGDVAAANFTVLTAAPPAQTVPPAPTGLSPANTTLAAGTASVTLTWNPVAGTTWYAVRANDATDPNLRAPGNNCGAVPHYLCVNSGNANSLAVPVTAGHSYYWWVHACNQFGCSDPASSSFSVAAAPPSTYLYSQFVPYGVARTGYFSNPPAGVFYPDIFWKTTPRSSTWTDVQWGPATNIGYLNQLYGSVEEHEIRTGCYGGQEFVWLNAYRADYPPSSAFPYGFSPRFPVTTTKAILIDSAGTTDITSGGGCGTSGQPYAKHVVDGNPYTIRVWGNLYDNLGALAKRWFWQARYTLTSPIVNSCWVGSGANVRPTLLQEEVWWESTATQWLMGNGVNLGEMGSPTNGPYAPAGNSPDPTKLEPTGNALVMNRSQYMGLDAGWLWYGSNPTGLYCLRSTQ